LFACPAGQVFKHSAGLLVASLISGYVAYTLTVGLLLVASTGCPLVTCQSLVGDTTNASLGSMQGDRWWRIYAHKFSLLARFLMLSQGSLKKNVAFCPTGHQTLISSDIYLEKECQR
jgi:hypothetical protein